MVNCKFKDGVIDITGLKPGQAQQIKIALLQFEKRSIPNGSRMWREEQKSILTMIGMIDQSIDDYCRNLDKQ